MNLIEMGYHNAVITPSDINAHIPVLHEYAKRCRHITEFGVRNGVSTMAFLSANPERLVSYDLFRDANVTMAFEEARELGKNYSYLIEDVLKADIEETDLLFIDTFHSEIQLSQELNLHSRKARRYLIFHDVETYGWVGEDGKNGILRVLIEFLTFNHYWHPVYYTRINNGLLILGRNYD